MDTLRYKDIEKMANDVTLKPNGWNEWAKYVLLSIETLTEQQKVLNSEVNSNKDEYIAAINALTVHMTEQFGEMKKELGIMKTKTERKATLISAVVGGIPAISALIYFLLNLVNG